jgi:hypothetical protein
MAKIIIPLALVSILLVCCNNNEPKGKDQNDSILTINTNNSDLINKTENPHIEYIEEETDNVEVLEDIKSINELLKINSAALKLSNSIQKAIADKKYIKTMDEIERTLEMRDNLIEILNADENFESQMLNIEAIWNYFESFEKIGISFVTAEGIYICLDKAPLLTDLVEKYADEPMKIKIKIENLYGSMRGGEYPFTNIDIEMELIPLAEKMLTEYPGYKHNKEIARMLDRALMPLVDFHTVGCDDSYSYIVGNFSVDQFPGVTDISYHKRFISDAKKSRFSKLVEKILSSPSNLCDWGDTLYYIAVPDLQSGNNVFADDKLNEKLKNLPIEFKDMNDSFKYLWLGVDVPHYLTFSKDENHTNVVAYRFYDNKKTALKSLETIQKVLPGALLIEHLFSDKEKKYELGQYD